MVFSIQSILENGLILGETESKGRRRTVFFTPLILLVEIPMKENPVMIT